MTLTVRQVSTEGPDFDRYITVCANAYPNSGFNTPAALQTFAEGVRESTREPAITLWGAYRDGTVVGAMRYFDFAMRIRSVEGFVGGVGMVGTDLAHKRTG